MEAWPERGGGLLTVLSEGHVVLDEGLEVEAMGRHVAHGVVAQAQVTSGVTFQLIPQSPEQAVPVDTHLQHQLFHQLLLS